MDAAGEGADGRRELGRRGADALRLPDHSALHRGARCRPAGRRWRRAARHAGRRTVCARDAGGAARRAERAASARAGAAVRAATAGRLAPDLPRRQARRRLRRSPPAAARTQSPPKPPRTPAKDLGGASPPQSPQKGEAADPEAAAAFAKVEGMLAHSHTKLFALFKRMDADLDGAISVPELIAGFKSLSLEISDSEVKAFFRRVEPSGAATTSLKALHKALRPKTQKKGGADASRDAADAPITSEDLVTDGLTEEEAAQLRAEAHLKAGRLPSLSPDEDDEGGGGGSGRKGKGSSGVDVGGFVWSQLEQRIAPEGVDKVPTWQREALSRVQWQVDVNQRKVRRDAKLRYEQMNPSIPSWDKPKRPSKKKLVENELRQMRLQQHSAESDDIFGGGGHSTRTSMGGRWGRAMAAAAPSPCAATTACPSSTTLRGQRWNGSILKTRPRRTWYGSRARRRRMSRTRRRA